MSGGSRTARVVAVAAISAAGSLPAIADVFGVPSPPSSGILGSISNNTVSSLQNAVNTAVQQPVQQLQQQIQQLIDANSPLRTQANALLAQYYADKATQIEVQKEMSDLIIQYASLLGELEHDQDALNHPAIYKLSIDQIIALQNRMKVLPGLVQDAQNKLTRLGTYLDFLRHRVITLLDQLSQMNQQLLASGVTPVPLPTPFAPEEQPSAIASNPAFAAMAYASRSRPTFLPVQPWSVWSQGNYNSASFGGAAPANGSTGVVSGGIGYRFSRFFTAGISVSGEESRFNTRFNGGYMNGSGPTIAPYASFQFTPDLMLNVTGGAAFLTMNTSDGTRTGQYDATRLFAAASLIDNWRNGPFRFSPSVNVTYGVVKSDSYIASDGTAFPARNTTFGRLSAGPEWGYTIPLRGGTMEPYVFAAVQYDFGDTSSIIAANGTVFAPGTLAGRAGGGFKISMPYGWSGSASASYDSIGAKNQGSWTAAVSLRLGF